MQNILQNLALFTLLLTATVSHAAEPPRYVVPSANLYGLTGLNQVPSARMDIAGMMRVGVATSDPYLNSFIGFQLHDDLYINMRQTMEVSSLNDSADRLYPALDFKFRLQEESAQRPEISIGANSAFGHKKTAGEYIVFSKRKNNFDFTGGVGWGRMAGSGHLKNPFSFILDNKRDYNDEDPQNLGDWFGGEEIGFFGGVEYFLPLKGLSLKADYGGMDYDVEAVSIAGFDAPSPWSVAVNYRPIDNADFSFGVVGAEKFMARLSLQGNVKNYVGRGAPKSEPPALTYPRLTPDEPQSNFAFLSLNTTATSPQQIGRASRVMANNITAEDEVIHIALSHKGLKGPKLKLIRDDLERGLASPYGSIEEIWSDAEFEKAAAPKFSFKNFDFNQVERKFILKNQLSLSEEDGGILYRSSALINIERQLPFGLRLGLQPRVNLAHNVPQFMGLNSDTTRGNESDFADNGFTLNQFYAQWLYSVNKDLHVNLTTGYLEEIYAGMGGEILYRPFGKRYALGAELWRVNKRDPLSASSMAVEDDKIYTGHVNMFYELPYQNSTIYGRFGQYLNEDIGGTLGFSNQFKNGVTMDAFVTATNKRDRDIFGGDNHLYSGLKLTLPIGNIPFIPDGAEIQNVIAPLARNNGQALQPPNPLYETTEPVAYRHLKQNWSDLLR